jgi:uncharacterized protein DUF4062
MYDQPLKVFVSSTTQDLGPYRDKVADAITRLEDVPITMNSFGASSRSPLATSVERVGDCDIFVGLIGYRYGFVPEGETKSVTEQEYDAAVANHKSILMYVPASAYTGGRSVQGQLPTAQPAPDEPSLRFIDRIQREGHTCGPYDDPADLPHIVAVDLVRFQKQGAPSLQGTRALWNGIAHLEIPNYPSAINDLGWAVQLLPREGTPSFLLALALLKGLRPRFHTLDEIRQVEQCLGVAEQRSPSRAVYALHSALESDYYVQNGFGDAHRMRVAELERAAFGCEPDPYNLKLISRFQPDLARDYLQRYL